MRMLRLARKIMSVIRRSLIRVIEFVSVNAYMKAYVSHLQRCGVNILGTPKYIHPSAHFDGADYSRITLGDRVTISMDVLLLTHDYSITTAVGALGQFIARGEGELYLSEPITIGNDCFIGARATLLPGTVIGENVIVGAGSVVKGKVESNVIIAGNPARIIGRTDAWAMRKMAEGRVRVEA